MKIGFDMLTFRNSHDIVGHRGNTLNDRKKNVVSN